MWRWLLTSDSFSLLVARRVNSYRNNRVHAVLLKLSNFVEGTMADVRVPLGCCCCNAFGVSIGWLSAR